MKKSEKIKKFTILGILFLLPITAYLFFSSGVNNFAKLPVLTKGVLEIDQFESENKVKKEFPNISVSRFSPPYKAQFTKSETAQMTEKVNDFKPDILFVGMTAPKQEKWVFVNKENIYAKTIVSIGAVFDFYAGTIKRPGNLWVSLGLEWFPRFLKEPKRLAKRNLVSTPKFLLEIMCYKIFGRCFL